MCVKKRLFLAAAVISVILFTLASRPVSSMAQADFSDYSDASVRRPLIQATDVFEEYESLVNLGFLDVGDNPYRTRENAADPADGARACVVQVMMGESYGSGVLWDVAHGLMIVASNKHLLAAAEEGEVIFPSGQRVQGSVLGLSEKFDLGFLSIPLTAFTEDDLRMLRFAGRSDEAYVNLRPGDEIFIVGSASSAAGDYREGNVAARAFYLEEFKTQMLYLYLEAEPGMSGCGTYDKAGNFVGMITAGNDRKEALSLPAGLIWKEYRALLAGTGTSLDKN